MSTGVPDARAASIFRRSPVSAAANSAATPGIGRGREGVSCGAVRGAMAQHSRMREGGNCPCVSRNVIHFTRFLPCVSAEIRRFFCREQHGTSLGAPCRALRTC
eukprot:3667804-Prymnesium_polylepis.1